MRRLPWFLTVSLLIVLLLGGSALAYNEAPMLAENVQAGLLPPVEERLPENPLVLEPWRQSANTEALGCGGPQIVTGDIPRC